MSIVGSGEELLRVWRERERSDGHGVTLQGVDQLPAGGRAHVKDVDDAVNGSAGNELAVGTLFFLGKKRKK